MSLTLRFPAEHTVPDVLPLEAWPPAPAPVLVPGPPLPPAPPAAPPAPEIPSGWRWKAATAAGAVATALAVTVVAALGTTTRSGTPTASAGDDLPGGAPMSTQDTVVTVEPTPSETAPTDEATARQLLADQLETDRPQVEALTGYWVPQLSSKRPGLVVNGTTYDYRAIWADFTSQRERYPGALLVWSGDYTSFRLGDFFVTVMPQPYGDGEAANQWCAQAGIGSDDCYAKRITHTGGYAENTLLRK